MSTPDKKQKKLRREADELMHLLHKFRIYQRDVLAPELVDELVEIEVQLHDGVRQKKGDELEPVVKRARKLRHKHCPPSRWDWVTENVEVAVVAIVIALAIRTYFLQPFKIPTGSMEPTLNGVRLVEHAEAFPSLPVRVWEMVVAGRSYVDVQAQNGGSITNIRGGQYFLWFEYTDIYINDVPHRVWANVQAVQKYLRAKGDLTLRQNAFGREEISSVATYRAGDTVIRAAVDTGDQVLVNKMAFHFFRPVVGDVIVFTTAGIPTLMENREGSQFYIKRCTGTPGDVLELRPPKLYIDGKPVEEPPIFQAIYSGQNGYNGYVFPRPNSSHYVASLKYLKPGQSYTVPPRHYWAMGDNSKASLDSRFWGGVPQRDLSGTAWIVYWPFTSHWGWIK